MHCLTTLAFLCMQFAKKFDFSVCDCLFVNDVSKDLRLSCFSFVKFSFSCKAFDFDMYFGFAMKVIHNENSFSLKERV